MGPITLTQLEHKRKELINKLKKAPASEKKQIYFKILTLNIKIMEEKENVFIKHP